MPLNVSPKGFSITRETDSLPPSRGGVLPASVASSPRRGLAPPRWNDPHYCHPIFQAEVRHRTATQTRSHLVPRGREHAPRPVPAPAAALPAGSAEAARARVGESCVRRMMKACKAPQSASPTSSWHAEGRRRGATAVGLQSVHSFAGARGRRSRTLRRGRRLRKERRDHRLAGMLSAPAADADLSRGASMARVVQPPSPATNRWANHRSDLRRVLSRASLFLRAR
jgi:hypothetical protein